MFVVCNAMYRSGSNLQYNIVRSLVEKIDVGLSEGFFTVQQVVSKKEIFEDWFKDGKYHVIKMHEPYPARNEKEREGIKVCYIFRDIRDVAVSLKNKSGLQGEQLLSSLEDAVSTFYAIRSFPRILVQRYEDLVGNLFEGIIEMCEFLGLKVDETITKEVVKECSMENVLSIVKSLQGKKNGMGVIFDGKTLLHSDHISSYRGKTGVWKSYLSKIDFEKGSLNR